MTADELNQSCIEKLRSVDLTHYVVVVGSGPSSPYIAPSGRLQEMLCERCGIDKNGTEMFWSLAQRAFEANPDQYYQVIHDSYGTLPYWQARTYTHIAAIPFLGFITFNYDDQLPSACQHAMGESFSAGFTVNPPRNGQRSADAADFVGIHKQVFCIHGYRDHNNPEWHKEVTLKTSDYDYHYTNQTSNQVFRFWKNLLVLRPCLFIGTSLEEPGLYKVLEDLRANNPDALARNRNLHLVPCNTDPATNEYPPARRSLGAIEQIRFDRIDTRYTGLIQILGALSGIPTESPSPNAPAPLAISATNNFIFFDECI